MHIYLSKSYMIGDSDNDMKAGEAAGCRCIRIERNGDLLEAVKRILEEEK
ncbi:MAG: HAD hydrolase-like protein [Erysipelotrichaceae bacterium]|nr:HAD hydrolase-like protein [Erysipelotrichaceae bacterium]